MLRQVARRLLAQASAAASSSGSASTSSRALTTSAARLDEAAPAAGPKEFKDAWAKKAAPNLDPPLTPTTFIKSGSTGESKAQGDLFPVNFYMPHGVLADNVQKDAVILPGVDGYFGIKANHVPIISQLKPGIVELHSGTEVEKYFVSGGFAFVHPNGVADICVLEAATLDQFDSAAVKSALASATSAAGQGDEEEQAATRAAQELYSTLDSALDSKS